jgi:hypothetical protein
MKALEAIWRHRTKVVGYLGAGLAQLGTSGLITNAKGVAWIAFAASMCTLAIGHFNDYQQRKQETAP